MNWAALIWTCQKMTNVDTPDHFAGMIVSVVSASVYWNQKNNVYWFSSQQIILYLNRTVWKWSWAQQKVSQSQEAKLTLNCSKAGWLNFASQIEGKASEGKSNQ